MRQNEAGLQEFVSSTFYWYTNPFKPRATQRWIMKLKKALFQTGSVSTCATAKAVVANRFMSKLHE